MLHVEQDLCPYFASNVHFLRAWYVKGTEALYRGTLSCIWTRNMVRGDLLDSVYKDTVRHTLMRVLLQRTYKCARVIASKSIRSSRIQWVVCVCGLPLCAQAGKKVHPLCAQANPLCAQAKLSFFFLSFFPTTVRHEPGVDEKRKKARP